MSLVSSTLRLLLLALVAGGTVALAQSLPDSSPFLPPAAGAAAAGPGAKYQLGGITTAGKETMVSITRVNDKRSFWIAVGGTVDEVTVLTANPARDEATIRANNQTMTLRLRQPTSPGGGASVAANASGANDAPPVITPPLPPPVGGPDVQEREARMLVTDLLEIGQQHRKAYEEAQRKAAEEKKKSGK
ncbi:MAG TPA: hypothetical protein PLU52_10465 [Opitutaceae bacterium]|nr:hypothetical protein [Opitutaceae bacterium]HND62244.1 hypothetical protein [Opitutaceae bacterium]